MTIDELKAKAESDLAELQTPDLLDALVSVYGEIGEGFDALFETCCEELNRRGWSWERIENFCNKIS